MKTIVDAMAIAIVTGLIVWKLYPSIKQWRNERTERYEVKSIDRSRKHTEIESPSPFKTDGGRFYTNINNYSGDYYGSN